MSDLLSLLSLGSSALTAQNSGVGVATNNVANMNTAGYSRESVELESLIGPPTLGGVRAAGITRAASDMLAARIRSGSGSLGRSQTMSDNLGDFEATLASGPSISDSLAAMFAKLGQVAATPTDKNLRDAAVSSIGDVVDAIHSAAGTVADATKATDDQIGSIATQATSLANQLAAANKAALAGGDPSAADRRDQLAKQLSTIVGGQAHIDATGNMRFVLDGGAVLVDGNHAASMSTGTDPATGLSTVNVVDGPNTRDVTAQISGGQLGGQLAVRDQLTSVAAKYDQYAFDLAQSFNSVSSANSGIDGVSGRNMFVAPTSVAGAAAALELDPGLAANSDQLATAASGAAAGDNTGANALYGLATASVASGGTRTLTDAAVDIVTAVGQQVSTAKANAQTDSLVGAHLDDLRDSLSGVDPTEEETNLSKFESTSAALTKFVSTINDMLTNLIQGLT
jgi:flagellar hook-associated protein 1 FlgK